MRRWLARRQPLRRRPAALTARSGPLGRRVFSAVSRTPSRKRTRALGPLVAGAAISVSLLLSSDRLESERLLLRSTALLGAATYQQSVSELLGTERDEARVLAEVLADAVEWTDEWRRVWTRGGLEALQDETIDRLLDRVLEESDGRRDDDMLCFLVARGALPVLVQYVAMNKPTDACRLQKLVRVMEKLLVAAATEGHAELWLSLVMLAQALGHLAQYRDTIGYVDMLMLGDALLQVQQLSRRRLDEGMGPPRAFTASRGILGDQHSSHVPEACSALVELCSPEMPLTMKRFALWALTTLVEAVDRQEPSAWRAQQLEAALNPSFAALLLLLPRDGQGVQLQLQAATLLDALLHTAQLNPALVTRDTYELWMKQIRHWAETQEKDKDKKTGNASRWTWLGTQKKEKEQKEEPIDDQEAARVRLQLQLSSARCLRTLATAPKTRRYLCESLETRAALFQLSRQVYEVTQHMGTDVDEDVSSCVTAIQRHVSWAFRNICTGFQSGAVALDCLFDSSWTASLLQSRRDLPMSRFFHGLHDLTDLPIVGAEEYEASTEFGWVDILTAWSASPNRQVRENAIASLVYLAEQDQTRVSDLTDQEAEVRSKQEHILQAWLTSMLQHIRLLSGGELLAVKQMEQIAHVSEELTPGNERVLFNPAVVDAGTSALAVLAEHHHTELVQHGVVPLMALLASTSAATSTQHTQCARVLANLVATCCLSIDSGSAVPSSDLVQPSVVNDHVDIAHLLAQTQSGKRFLSKIQHWNECDDPMQRSNYYRVVQNLRAYDDVVVRGTLTKDVYCEGVHPIVQRSETVPYSGDGDNGDENSPAVDVVFVHGLRGHPFGTWRTDMGSDLEGSNDIWPDVLLAEDLRRKHVSARLVTLGYEAGMVSWSSPWPSLTLQERARVMLSALYAANIGRDRHYPDKPGRPVVFVTHSMGGLLVKKMLLLEREQEAKKVSRIADSTTGLVFLAVPHFGSDLAKGVRSESVRRLIQTHPAIQDLGADPDGRLETLNESFKRLGIDCLSVGEEHAAPLALGLSAVVVKPESADPGVGRFYVLPDSDHMTICKAKDRDEPLYQDILQYVVRHATADSHIVDSTGVRDAAVYCQADTERVDTATTAQCQ